MKTRTRLYAVLFLLTMTLFGAGFSGCGSKTEDESSSTSAAPSTSATTANGPKKRPLGAAGAAGPATGAAQPATQ